MERDESQSLQNIQCALERNRPVTGPIPASRMNQLIGRHVRWRKLLVLRKCHLIVVDDKIPNIIPLSGDKALIECALSRKMEFQMIIWTCQMDSREQIDSRRRYERYTTI